MVKITQLLLLLTFVLLCCWSLSVSASGCHSQTPTYGPPNYIPILNGESAMVFINSTTNGRLYQVTVPNGGNSSTFWVIHVYGTPWEMGFAQGTLLKPQLTQFIPEAWNYMKTQIESSLPNFPKWLQDLIAQKGLTGALTYTYDVTRKYTGAYFFQELEGIANATGLSFRTLVDIHMIAGLTKGACSMFGAWGNALDSSFGSSLLQLRALDWDMDGPFRDYSSMTVYHPISNSDNGHPFVIVGFTGFIGGLTGMSSTQLGISEIGVSFPDDTFGSEDRISGVPFIFTLRDILQFDYTVDDAINRLINEKRTCDLILGVGDGKLSEFRGFQYSGSILRVFDDMNMEPYNETWHPRINDIVYYGMDWICPSYNKVLSHQLLANYGALTPSTAIQNVMSVEESGDNHLAIYDLTQNQIYVSFAAPNTTRGNPAAYARQFAVFNITTLFNQQN